MGLSIVAYLCLAMTGIWINQARQQQRQSSRWLTSTHSFLGWVLVFLVLLLLGIGIVGTLGHFGSLYQSPHFIAGWLVVALVLISAWTATQIDPRRPWIRLLHIANNVVLFFAMAWVSWTGWLVVQKYLE